MANRAERTLGYELHRLHEPVRERVMNKWRENSAHDEWWDSVYDDAKRMAALMGIEIDDIAFSGFWSQDNGASFTGRYVCKPDAVQAITAECDDEELLRIATALTQLQVTLQLQHGFTYDAVIRSTDRRYSHSGTMETGYNDDDFAASGELHAVGREYDKSFERLIRDFADWIYKQLEAEYEYLTSDDAVTESIAAAGLRFTPEGEILRRVL